MHLMIDAHLDLAWNALSYDRDQTLPVHDIRRSEAALTCKSRGNNTVSLPAMRQGRIGICLATLLARAIPTSVPDMPADIGTLGQRRHQGHILRQSLDYANQTIASAAAQGQLAYYRLLEQQGQMRQIRTRQAFESLFEQWRQADESQLSSLPVGYILSMEGTDPIIDPQQVEWWWQQGLRTACLAHYGPSVHAMGTGGDGPLTDVGRQVLREFARVGIILDLVHTADTAMAQAMDLYDGPVFVSHGNCRALCDGDRQISDQQIRQIADRGGVIGLVMDNWMLDPSWQRNVSPRDQVSLQAVADHIDHICQLTGSVRHAGIGSDLDGGFGKEQSPCEIDTIADLQLLGDLLAQRGYSDADVAAVMHGNWAEFFTSHLPD